jgi:hypothetical protein
VPYSTAEPAIFKVDKLKPVDNLKILIHDHQVGFTLELDYSSLIIRQKIAEHALTILINLSADREILENLATDDRFLGRVLGRVTVSLGGNLESYVAYG